MGFSDEFSRIASDSPPVISGTLESPPVIRRRGGGVQIGGGDGVQIKEKAVLVAVSGGHYWRGFQAVVLETRFCIDGKSGFGQSHGKRKESRRLLLATSRPRPMRHVADMWISPAYKPFCGTGGKTRV